MLLLWLTILLGVDGAAPTPDGVIGDENLVLGAGTSVAVDDGGNMFVMDPASYRVRVFTPDLVEKRAFGQRGKGPGEFEEPKVITRTPAGDLAVFDPSLKRLTVFNPKGELVRTARLDATSVAVYHPAVLREQRTAFLSARSHAGKPVYDLSIFDRETKPVSNLIRIQVEPLDWTKSSQPGFWVTFLKNEFELIGAGMPVMCSLDDNTLVYARTNRYQLILADADGTTRERITRDLKPKALTEALKLSAFENIWNRLTADPYLFNQMPRKVFERAAAQAETPPALPVIHAITPLGGGFAVLANYNGIKNQGRLDLFDRNGSHLKMLTYNGPADFLTGTESHLYSVGSNEEDLITVNRYRLE
ncbi:MAG: hypothetical protein QNK37_29680 [Acidobacteriota bacterium]|nr:hypothetical protein [Acidobacteriota bacterium]